MIYVSPQEVRAHIGHDVGWSASSTEGDLHKLRKQLVSNSEYPDWVSEVDASDFEVRKSGAVRIRQPD